MKTMTCTLMLASGVLLAACGGGGGDPAPDPDALGRMDPAAVATERDLHSTLTGLQADDRANPLTLDDVLPPTSDTAEPLTLE